MAVPNDIKLQVASKATGYESPLANREPFQLLQIVRKRFSVRDSVDKTWSENVVIP
jgi:hypothetical protein